jgi:hypothetical protein
VIECVKDYRVPRPGDTEKVKAATKLPPLQLPRRGIRPDDTGRMGQEAQGLPGQPRRRCDRDAARHRVRHAMTTDYKHGHPFYGKTEPNVSLPRPAGDHHSKQQLLLGLMDFGGNLPSTKITVTDCLGVEGWLVGSKVGIWPKAFGPDSLERTHRPRIPAQG